jgi:hypothetical protein
VDLSVCLGIWHLPQPKCDCSFHVVVEVNIKTDVPQFLIKLINKNFIQHFENGYTAITHLPTVLRLRMCEATIVRLSSPYMPTSCGRHHYTRKVSQKIVEKQKYLFDNTFKANKITKNAVKIHASTMAVTRFLGGLTLCMQKFHIFAIPYICTQCTEHALKPINIINI